MLSNNLLHVTPGLGIAVVAFGIYLGGEAAYNHFHLPEDHPTTHH
ncbi:NADH dehydrogenase ubiquinone 1 beta subcomplex subunit [Musa troglodytarum]|uniref:NADH dehydrogenase ubiquinone 1 beta subcomplex subunit n=1 Tax=Musa troglodytarum TaxID=320322 RepID=A0A9E7KT97_9LILI|nr:NADH dehydrogenase ubiquinone 1 beta subcomplex subunit [Musa troglodytarum]